MNPNLRRKESLVCPLQIYFPYLLTSSHQLLPVQPSLQCSTLSSVQNMSESSWTSQCGTISSPPVMKVISPKLYDFVSNKRQVQFPSEFQSHPKWAHPSMSRGMVLPGLAFRFTLGPFRTDSKGKESQIVQPRCSWKLDKFLMP